MPAGSTLREQATQRLGRLAGGRPLPPAVDRRARQLRRWAARRAQYLSGRLEGVAYRLGGHHPAEDVDDAVLTQRIRSRLGPLEKELDVPRVHVTVVDRVARLHGVVGTDAEARQLEQMTERVAGVRGVRSRLHIGYGPGDTRPSEGRATIPPSPAWRELVGAARSTGLDDDGAERAARATLATLLSSLPEDERAHVLAHLPEDVQRHAHPPLEVGRMVRPRSVGGFDRAVAERAGLPRRDAAMATRSIIDALHRLVPEEVDDVEAVLPTGLKALWATPGHVEVTT